MIVDLMMILSRPYEFESVSYIHEHRFLLLFAIYFRAEDKSVSAAAYVLLQTKTMSL